MADSAEKENIASAAPWLAYMEENFQKLRKVKESDKGEVWLAEDKVSGRLVILKRIAFTGLPYARLKEKDFPLCPRIFHCVEEGGETLVVEEYIAGESLLDRIGRGALLEEKEALGLLLQLCEGLAPIHAEGILHRDIKPSNIIMGKSGHASLIDFDAARMTRENGGEDTRLLGTRGYAPPEQYGYGQTDARSDIYAIGVTLKAALPKGYKGYLVPVLEKCTNLDPERRYKNLSALRRTAVQREIFAKWGRPLLFLAAAAAAMTVVAYFPSLHGDIEQSPQEVAEDRPVEAEKEAALPTVKEETAEKADNPYVEEKKLPEALNAEPIQQETKAPVSEPVADPPPPQEYHDPFKVDPSEISNIETKEDFLNLFADEPEKREAWSQDNAFAAEDGATEEEKRKAEREQLEYMKHLELSRRAEAFMAQLPESMSEEERGRAINEFVAEQRKILGIKNWP